MEEQYDWKLASIVMIGLGTLLCFTTYGFFLGVPLIIIGVLGLIRQLAIFQSESELSRAQQEVDSEAQAREQQEYAEMHYSVRVRCENCKARFSMDLEKGRAANAENLKRFKCKKCGVAGGLGPVAKK